MNALPGVARSRRRVAALPAVVLAVLALGTAQAGAVVVDAAPVWPIPADVGPAPPPLAAMPAAGAEAPPAEAIADPVTPAAVCGGWYLQSDYGDRWPAGSTWWEYRCTHEHAEYYPHPCDGPICEPVCYGYPFDCYWLSESWEDLFYWDGSNAVFYGESYAYSFEDGNGYSGSFAYWWDGPTTEWYEVVSTPPTESARLTVSKAGAGSGQVSSSPAGIDCGSSCQASFDAATEVSLSATPDASSVFSGWSGVCSGTGSCRWRMDQARSVTATFAPKPPPNAAPAASLSVSCTGLTCTAEGAGSSDSDGTIESYRWDFGDGTTAGGSSVQHTYTTPGSYTISLTVTDDDGASDTAARAIALIRLTARGYKVKGLQKVDLSWSGVGGTGYDVYRDGLRIVASISGSSYTDNLNRKGLGSYAYKVCHSGSAICSNQATVNF